MFPVLAEFPNFPENFAIALLTLGVFFFLLGVLGKVHVKDFEAGTDSLIVRFLSFAIGSFFIVLSIGPFLPSPPPDLSVLELGQTTEGDSAIYTDFDVYICEQSKNSSNKLAQSVMNKIVKSERYGLLTYGLLDKDILSNQDVKSKFTILVDREHDESQEVQRIKNWLRASDSNLEIQVLDDSRPVSEWRIVIVICK
ncbi:MAG: hypothetical protein QNJ53_06010 [Pleurocapsa sp. MO_192.B19]|nr:hypothetical protein [Pleurocapsa sp. MO_192.B19]